MISQNLNNIWNQVLKKIKSHIPQSSYQAWIKPAKLVSIDENIIKIDVRNEFNCNLITQNYYQLLLKAFKEILQLDNIELEININTDIASDDENYQPTLLFADNITEDNTSVNTHSLSESKQVNNTSLNKAFTFENFVVGSHNQFCHAVALSIANDIGNPQYNPLFLHGGVGLGKTHLMHAIGNFINKHKPETTIQYITTEQFLNDLIDFMRKGKMDSFRQKYRKINLLLIDDIQFIEGKESTQQEFFHTFNALKEQSSQIIMTSDRPPKAINKLEPRLCSRFEGGLIADVQPPTFETRLAILERQSEKIKINLPSSIAHIIAEAYPENIRSLQGALNKIAAYANFANETIDELLVAKVLNLKEAEESQVHSIVKSVAYLLDLNITDIKGPARQKKYIEARQIIVHIARLSTISWSEISAGLGNRGNSSLINLNRNLERDLQNNEFKYIQVLNKLKEQFNV